MILSENRVPLFGIMLWGEGREGQENRRAQRWRTI